MTTMDVKIETEDNILEEEQMERDEEVDENLVGDEEVDENFEGDEEVDENFEGDEEVDENFEGGEEADDNFQGDEEVDENFEGGEEVDENFEGDEVENLEGDEQVEEKLEGDEQVEEKLEGDEQVEEKLEGDEQVEEKLEGDEQVEEKYEGDEEEDDDEILLEKYVFLYTIPNLTSSLNSNNDQSENKDGDSSKKRKQKGSNQSKFKASEWDIANPVKTCKFVLFAAGPFCHIQLEYVESQEQPVFGQSVIEKDFNSILQPTKDSSRYFVFKFQNIKGEYETMGLGFINRSDSADVMKILKLYFESENKEAVTTEARSIMALSKQAEMGENETPASTAVESTAPTSSENPASVKPVSTPTPGKETQATTSKTAINNTDTINKNTNNSKKPNSQSQPVQNSEPASKRMKPNAQKASVNVKTRPSRENDKMKPKTNTNYKNPVSKTIHPKGSLYHQKIPDLRAIKVSPPKSRGVLQQPTRHPPISPWEQHLPNAVLPNPILFAPPPPIISVLAVPDNYSSRFPDRDRDRNRDRNRSSSIKSSPIHSRRTSRDTNARHNGFQRRYDRDTVGSGSASRDSQIPQCRICTRIGRTRQLNHGPEDCPLNKSKKRSGSIPDLFSLKVNPNLNNGQIKECLFCLHKGQLSGRDLCHSYLDCPTLREGCVQGSVWELPPTVSNPVISLYDPVPSMPQVHFRPTFPDARNGNLNFDDGNNGLGPYSADDPVFWQHPDPRNFESPQPSGGSNYFGPSDGPRNYGRNDFPPPFETNNGPAYFEPNPFAHGPEPGTGHVEMFGGPGIFALNDRPGLLGPAPCHDPEAEFYHHPSGVPNPNEYLNGNRNSIPSLFDIPAVPGPIWQSNEGYNNSNIHMDDPEDSWEIPECPHCLRSGKTYNLHHYREDCPSQVRRSVMS